MKAMNDIDRMIADIDMEVAATRGLIGRDSLDERVMQAMRKVPRDKFVPGDLRRFAFDNGPLPIGHQQTISQPYIVALMTDLLEPEKNKTVLEIGTGSGYQAAVLSLLVKKVYTMEFVKALSEQAAKRFRELHYDNIECRTGNGYLGWPERAPYDGIIITAAATHIPEALVEQLKPGGRMVLPVGMPFSHQELLLLEKDRYGNTQVTDILGVAFVPMLGEEDVVNR